MMQRLTPSQLSRQLAEIHRLQTDVEARQRSIVVRARRLAAELASLMDDGEFHHRIGVGLHAFDVDGKRCLAASTLEEDNSIPAEPLNLPPWHTRHVHEFAILVGGDAARRYLRSAPIPAALSSDPDGARRVRLATHGDFDAFLYRLARYIGDVARTFEDAWTEAGEAESRLRDGRIRLEALRELQPLRPRLPQRP